MFINESFLSFIWQNLYFNSPNLKTTRGEPIFILDRGYLNRNSGPDFLEARIRIGEIVWAGDVEIHTNSSHWTDHRHDSDSNYNRVILHVVYRDIPATRVLRYDGSEMPTLELSKYIDAQTVYNFHRLVDSLHPVPCGSDLPHLPRMKLISMVDRALIDRLERKAEMVYKLLDEADNDWETVAYRLLVCNFGFKINQANMLLLSRLAPHMIVTRLRDNEFQLEALLFGMAGFLSEPQDDYQWALNKEFEFLKRKYDLNTGILERYHWKFMRMHPQNFPTVRIAQMIKILANNTNFFASILNTASISSIFRQFSVVQGEYWQTHYDFNKKSKRRLSGIGISSIENMIINTFTPILTAYSKTIDDQRYLDKAIFLLESLAAENNRVIRLWQALNIQAMNASESQGLMELYNEYCRRKQCLSCSIGSALIRFSSP